MLIGLLQICLHIHVCKFKHLSVFLYHNISKVETFILQAVKLTKSSSINIAKCICFLSHLKNFKLSTESSMEDFLATLHSQASQSKVVKMLYGNTVSNFLLKIIV